MFSFIFSPSEMTASSSTTSSPFRKEPTITDQISTTTRSHLDYQSFQNDGEYVASMSKQYHSGETDLENDVGDEDYHRNPLDRGPFFEVSSQKNITAIAGHSAYLNCRVRNLGNRTVSESVLLISANLKLPKHSHRDFSVMVMERSLEILKLSRKKVGIA